jgi:ribonuclease HI
LVQALQYAKGKQVNIYTDSKYAFATLHVHGAIYKVRGLLTSGGKEIKSKEKIFQLLKAVWEPSRVADMHGRGHERGTDFVSRGNSLVDQAAKRTAAEELSFPEVPKQTAKLLLAPELPPTPNYTKEEEQWTKDEKGIEEKGGW